MSRIGLMGGTFNPIHTGHLMLAEEARVTFSLDEIWVIPTGCSYLKKDRTECGEPTSMERLEMTARAVADVPYFSCLDIEVRREGNTYTYETVEELKSQFPQHEFYFIMGADCLDTIGTWKCPDRLFANCKVIAAVRGDSSVEGMQSKVEELKSDFAAQIFLMPFRNISLSSTEIRERVREGKSIRFLVPDAVLSYIEEKGFYVG